MNAQQKMGVRLARHFQLDVATSELIKAGVYRVKVQNGKTYCIKRLNYAANEVSFLDRVLRRLMRAGYTSVCWRDAEAKPRQLMTIGNQGAEQWYVLTPWIEGRTPDAASHSDMRACAQELARFHLAARGIAVPACPTRQWLGEWPQLFAMYRQLIEGYRVKGERGRLSEGLGQFMREHGTAIVQDADLAIELLARSAYAELCEQAKEARTYCHADSGPKNFVLSRTGPVLIDFETLRMDLRIYDIYRMIRLANKSNDWDFSVAETILTGYQQIDKLAKEEYALLAAWLLFPHKTYRILRKYHMRTEAGKRELELSLQQEQVARAKLMPFLEHLHGYMKRG